MLLWTAFAFLTAAVLAWMLAPLAKPAPEGDSATAEAGTRAVYRDQLAEIEAERAAGLLGAAEAEAAKLEISRRLLASAARSEPVASAAGTQARHHHAMLTAAVAVPLLALGLYLAYGSPGVTSSTGAHTEAAREAVRVQRMVAEVERRLRETPNDAAGWEVIAPIYVKLGRFSEASTAYTNAVRLGGESPKLLAGLAEASILAKGGIVTEEARSAFERLLKLEPGRMEPRFWLSMGKEQDGRFSEALAGYKALLGQAPPGAPYRTTIEKRIAEVSARMANTASAAPAKDQPQDQVKAQVKEQAQAQVSEPVKASPAKGPTAADMAAAAELSPQQREAMIAGMVDGLADRLKRDGRDLAGWQRLVNAYAVLGRRNDARTALAEARRHFEGDTTALSDLSRLAATLGLGS